MKFLRSCGVFILVGCFLVIAAIYIMWSLTYPQSK